MSISIAKSTQILGLLAPGKNLIGSRQELPPKGRSNAEPRAISQVPLHRVHGTATHKPSMEAENIGMERRIRVTGRGCPYPKAQKVPSRARKAASHPLPQNSFSSLWNNFLQWQCLKLEHVQAQLPTPQLFFLSIPPSTDVTKDKEDISSRTAQTWATHFLSAGYYIFSFLSFLFLEYICKLACIQDF